MSVSLYVGNNGDTRALANIARDLAEVWPDATIHTTLADLKGTRVVFNQMLDQIERIEAQRRFTGCGPQVCLFSANVAEIGEMKTRQALMWLETVPVIVHSKFHYDEVRAMLSVFSAGYRRTLEKNLHYIPGGIHPAFSSTGENDRNRWIVPCNRFNQTQKQMGLHASITGKALHLIKGHDITTHYYLRAMDELAGSTADLSLYNVQVCPPTREAYIENARASGVYLATAAFESFGLMYLELLMCGVVGVFLDRPWVRALLPDYPFVATAGDLPAMLAAVHHEYPKAHAYVQDTAIPYIQKNYSFDAFATRTRAVLDATAKGTTA